MFLVFKEDANDRNNAKTFFVYSLFSNHTAKQSDIRVPIMDKKNKISNLYNQTT